MWYYVVIRELVEQIKECTNTECSMTGYICLLQNDINSGSAFFLLSALLPNGNISINMFIPRTVARPMILSCAKDDEMSKR